MIGPFDYHLFAHVGGRYQTAEASPNVNAAERTALEQFFFGQSNDEPYLASLSKEPGLIWRRAGDRIALTRVLRGTPDAHGRATLRFETILIPTARAQGVSKSLAGIALGRWEKRGTQIVIPAIRSTAPLQLHPELISHVLLTAQDKKRYVGPANQASLRDVASIVGRCLADPQFTLCYKSLNSTAPTTVNFVYGDSQARILKQSPRERKMQPLPSPRRSNRTTPASSPW